MIGASQRDSTNCEPQPCRTFEASVLATKQLSRMEISHQTPSLLVIVRTAARCLRRPDAPAWCNLSRSEISKSQPDLSEPGTRLSGRADLGLDANLDGAGCYR